MGWVLGFVVVVVAVLAVIRVARAKPNQPSGESASISATGTASSWPQERRRAPPAVSRRRQPEFPLKWFGRESELEVAGFRLQSPCVYASSSTRATPWEAADPSEIQLQASVSAPDASTGPMGYWPWYSRIEPGHRFGYLSWLASGRTSLPSNEGYLFLFYYGIERRLLIDQTDTQWGLQEVVRLRRLDHPRVGTKEGRSFRQYSTNLLWFEVARTPEKFDQKTVDRIVSLTERWTPQLLAAPLSWCAAGGRPLPASLAYHIAEGLPASQRSTVIKRVPEEFAELFGTRYRETFGGEGMPLRVSKRNAVYTYRPASGGLPESNCHIVNPMGIPSQFKMLPSIWNSCIADLRRLSRVTSASLGEELTIDAWEAMPEELRSQTDHPLADRVSTLVAEQSQSVTDEAGDAGSTTAMVPAGRFASLIGIDQRPKLTSAQSQKVASTIHHTGFGIVPDARISSVRYGWDDLVAVIPGLDRGDVDPRRLSAASCVLRLGLSIALADGEADEIELTMLTDHIHAVFDLTPEEHQRLTALRDLLLKTGTSAHPTARKIEELLPPDARRKLGRMLVVIAAATNGIDRSERAALRKAFRTLDLPPELLEETIAEVAPDADESEVSVRSAGGGTQEGEAIPKESSTSSFRLNYQAISSIMSETREVSVLLAAAMGEETLETPASTESDFQTTQVSAVAEMTGPGGRYEPLFVALVAQDRWDRQSADEVARSHGLMLDAGVEAINDWAYDAFGSPLIDADGEDLVLDRGLLNDLE